jgi:hypothetical protein
MSSTPIAAFYANTRNDPEVTARACCGGSDVYEHGKRAPVASLRPPLKLPRQPRASRNRPLMMTQAPSAWAMLAKS